MEGAPRLLQGTSLIEVNRFQVSLEGQSQMVKGSVF